MTEGSVTELEIIPDRKPYVLFDQAKKDRVIEFVRDHGYYPGLMARCVGISGETLRHHTKHDQEFKARLDEVIEERSAELEREARRRAIEGVTRRKYDKEGTLIEEEQVYSDRLMERLLEADIEKFQKKSPFGSGQIQGGVLLIPLVPAEKAASVEDLSARLEKLSAVQTDLEATEGGTKERSETDR